MCVLSTDAAIKYFKTNDYVYARTPADDTKRVLIVFPVAHARCPSQRRPHPVERSTIRRKGDRAATAGVVPSPWLYSRQLSSDR